MKAALKRNPIIYEIVPPRRDTSRFSTELRGVEEVLQDGRITAINIPELIKRRIEHGEIAYSPATIPPEEYAMIIRDYKESIVNLIAPRMAKDEFLKRARKILHDYKIPNIIIVGKERREDDLPGLGVTAALRLLAAERGDSAALGGICIFSRRSTGIDAGGRKVQVLTEERRVWLKAEAGGDFFTGQITFESEPVLNFLRAYENLCDRTGREPLTIFISLATIPTTSILKLLESLDVVIPPRIRRRLATSPDMGRESARIAKEVFSQVISGAETAGLRVPIGLQIEQIGVNNGTLSLELLDSLNPIMRGR